MEREEWSAHRIGGSGEWEGELSDLSLSCRHIPCSVCICMCMCVYVCMHALWPGPCFRLSSDCCSAVVWGMLCILYLQGEARDFPLLYHTIYTADPPPPTPPPQPPPTHKDWGTRRYFTRLKPGNGASCAKVMFSFLSVPLSVINHWKNVFKHMKINLTNLAKDLADMFSAMHLTSQLS